MNKNFIKVAEKCSQDCESCMWHINKCEIKRYKKVVGRLEQKIDDCIFMDTDDKQFTNRLLTVIDTLYCLDIIDDNEATDYRARLDGVKK